MNPASQGRARHSGRAVCVPVGDRPPAFTLIELLVVIAIIAILAGLLLPAFARAREKAKAVRVHVELNAVGLALEMYADDHDGALPPVRVNCNSDFAAHWCQFPIELAREGYLPRGGGPGREANLEDLFNPGQTYKYAAPGPLLLNDDPGGQYQLWVPDDFPASFATTGKRHSDPKTSPVRWVVWSLGPRPNSRESLHSEAPLARASWYRRTGGGGVIARFAAQNGAQYKTP